MLASMIRHGVRRIPGRKSVREPSISAVALGHWGPAVCLHCALDAGRAGGEILQIHGRPNGEARIEGEKPRLGDGAQLRGFLHVEEDIAGPFSIILGEVGGSRLEIVQDALDSGPQGPAASRSVAGFDGAGMLTLSNMRT
jgi:hypothetical protein